MPRVLYGAVLLMPLLAAPAGPEIAAHADREWFRRTLADETARWRDAALTPNGFFAVSLDRAWRPTGAQRGTLVSQSRQIFVMAAGYELTGDRSYLAAVRQGTEFLLEHFRDPEHGLFFYSTDPQGTVLDRNKDSYGLAFVIFALSHAARATGEERYRSAALETWAQMKDRLRDSAGLIKPRTDRTYTKTLGQNTQNPMMHLFEALLALHGATGSGEVFRDAEELAARIFGRLFQDREGRLPEMYDADWKPAPAEAQGRIELGHQFEWAFLLSRAVEQGLPRRYLRIAERLLDYGMKAGYDAQEGGIFSRGDYAGGAVRGAKGWWEQCEALRAMLHWAAARGRKDLWPAFDRSLAFAKDHFIDSEYGGWYSSYDPKAPGRHTAKGSVWQAGYHVCGFYAEALRLLEWVPQ